MTGESRPRKRCVPASSRASCSTARATMRAVLGTSLAVLCLFSTARTTAQTQEAKPAQRFRSSADVVTIQASVRTTRGRPLQGLTADDFEVRDNGQLRPILSLSADLKSPVSLAILVDMSGSMALPAKIALARQAFDSILTQLQPGQDEVAV